MRLFKFIPILVGTLLLLNSCVKDELSNIGNVTEGEFVVVAMKMDLATMGSAPRTKAMTPEQENTIENIRVMVFNKDGRMVTNKKFVGNQTSLNVATYSGNNMSIYMVANAVAAAEQKLINAKTLKEVRDAIVTSTELGYGKNSTKPLLMTGVKTGVNITPGTYTVPEAIKLEFMAAKLTMIVKEKMTIVDESIEILGWDFVDIPRDVYIFPNTLDANPNPDKDNNDDFWLTTTGPYLFEAINAVDKTSTQVVYLPENRRGERVPNGIAPPNGGNQNDDNHENKAWYAPKRATHMVIYAAHKKKMQVNQIEMFIYLGLDEIQDYNIERGNHYTFTVTVNGLNDIDVDTNVDRSVTNFAVSHGDNLTMDSHPDFRPMQITAPQGTATMEIIDEGGRAYNEPGFTAKWLKISPLDLMYHQVKQSGTAGFWQQAGAVGSFVRAKYIPHKSVREQLKIMNIDGWNQILAGQEDDDVMTFANATHRMCYKITDIPFTDISAVTNKTLYVYADDYHVKDGERSAKIRVTFCKTGGDTDNPEELYFDIKQNGYLGFEDATTGLYELDASGNVILNKGLFVVERYVESSMQLNPSLLASVQGKTHMQWGFHKKNLWNENDKYRNGYFLTANAVYSDVTRTGQLNWTGTYREMYGNNIRYDGIGFKPIPNYAGQTLEPYYYPTATDNIYHPINNSSAARYCHEKNRDLNGDGNIDVSETRWYLPSQHELMLLWIDNTIPLPPALNWSSTESSPSNSNAWFVVSSNGTVYGEGKNNGVDGNATETRCVGRL